jgi:hypothetical protein
MTYPDTYPGEYIGDGVYASFDGWHVFLDLRKQDASRIGLEPHVLDALVEYRKRALDYQNAQLEAIENLRK